MGGASRTSSTAPRSVPTSSLAGRVAAPTAQTAVLERAGAGAGDRRCGEATQGDHELTGAVPAARARAQQRYVRARSCQCWRKPCLGPGVPERKA